MPTLIENNPKYWIIEINPQLREVGMPQKKRGGFTWVWGTDGNVYKLKRALYPKSLFTRSQMTKLMIKYRVCPNCNIGRKNLKFKYPKKQYTNMALKENFHMSYPFIWLTEKIIPRIAGNPSLHQFWKSYLSTLVGNVVNAPTHSFKEPISKYLYRLLVGAGLIGIGAVTDYKGWIGGNLRDELITMGTHILNTPSFNPVFDGFAPGEIKMLKESAARVIQKARVGSMSLQAPNVAIARIKNALNMGFGKIASNFNKIGSGRFWEVPTTHAPVGGGQFATKEAGDYGYQDADWFQDVSKFSPSFLSSQRLKISGEGHEY